MVTSCSGVFLLNLEDTTRGISLLLGSNFVTLFFSLPLFYSCYQYLQNGGVRGRAFSAFVKSKLLAYRKPASDVRARCRAAQQHCDVGNSVLALMGRQKA